MEFLLRDARLALRTFARRPLFTLVAVTTLTLGIGATTAIFSIVHAVLLRALPYPSPDRLVVLWGWRGKAYGNLLVSIRDVLDWKARSRTLADIGIVRSQSVNLSGVDAPDRLVGNFVTANSLTILGAHAAVGRLFTPSETAEGTGQQVAIVSHTAWQSRFGGDSSIVGHSLVLNGRPHVVIGVMGPEFRDPFGSVDVWLPITSAPNPNWFQRSDAEVWAIAQLQPGATIATAQDDLSRITAALGAEYPTTNAGLGARVISLREDLIGDTRPILWIMFAFVVIVLAVACANVANLQLAQAVARNRALALRAALGASRGRLAQQLLTESAILSLLGGIAGLVVATGLRSWAITAFAAATTHGLPAIASTGLSWLVLAFCGAITIATGILFGTAPALMATRATLLDSGAGRATARGDLRQLFVGTQIALCVVLLVGAGLLTRSLAALRRAPLGFNTHNVVTAELRLPVAKYGTPQDMSAFMTLALERIRSTPGIQSAALVQNLPLSGNWARVSYIPEGQSAAPGAEPTAETNTISERFFQTIGIAMLAGRDFASSDRADGQPVAIVNAQLAHLAWPDASPIGKRITLPGPPARTLVVVGVVGNVKQLTVGEPPTPQLYVPIAQSPGIFTGVVVRGALTTAAMTDGIRHAIWSVDADQPVWRLGPLEALVANNTAGPSLTATLTGLFAGLALALAIVGTYGLASFAVQESTRELGIRAALGATPGALLGMVLAGTLRVAIVALVPGLLASLTGAKLLRHQLFGVTTSDPVTFVGVPLLLATVTVLATYLPARRAARVDPVIALRSE
jgi:putative ABC transport system permease protein